MHIPAVGKDLLHIFKDFVMFFTISRHFFTFSSHIFMITSHIFTAIAHSFKYSFCIFMFFKPFFNDSLHILTFPAAM